MLRRAFTVISGLASLLGFGVSIGFTISAINKDLDSELLDVVILLGLSLSILLLSVVFIFVYYFRASERLGTDLSDLKRDKIIADRNSAHHQVLVVNSAEFLHNISHHFRDLICEIEEIKDSEGLPPILDKFDTFLNTLTANLVSYFNLLTGDQCAVTIKIARPGDAGISQVKTFYRDPTSYRKRSKSDRSQDGKLVAHEVADNTAFSIIASPEWRNTSYLCDNLYDEWINEKYENRTQGWQRLYNACAVVAISKKVKVGQRKILGFLCVDNQAGNMANSVSENFLNGIADMLYILFERYGKLAKMAIDEDIQHARTSIYTNWDNG